MTNYTNLIMTDYKRGVFKGEKTVEYLKSELQALLRNYAPAAMYGDQFEDFEKSMITIREDFEKFDNFNFSQFLESVNKKQKQNDPQYIAPTVFDSKED